MDADKKPGPASKPGSGAEEERAPDSGLDEFLARLHPDTRRPKPGQESAAVFQAIQRLALEADSEQAASAEAESGASVRLTCAACGSPNREGNRFCSNCGVPLLDASPEAPEIGAAKSKSANPAGQHHYHHHYHHHYLSPADAISAPGMDARASNSGAAREAARVRAPLAGPSLTRAETAVRKVIQDWALACNTKQLDDLVDFYSADALVLRPNVPPVRGTAAIREFFFGVLDGGFGDVEMEPLRVETLGDVAYEAGRCKSLVPLAMGKRREERGKYLVILNRPTPAGEWKIVTDSWSNDLSLGVAAEPAAKPAVPAPGSVAPRPPRKP